MPAPDDPPRRRWAAALRYDEERGGAPKVVAAGAGVIAERILELAAENGLAVREDPALAQALARLEVDREIPRELYAAVAEVLVWAYGLERPPAP